MLLKDIDTKALEESLKSQPGPGPVAPPAVSEVPEKPAVHPARAGAQNESVSPAFNEKASGTLQENPGLSLKDRATVQVIKAARWLLKMIP